MVNLNNLLKLFSELDQLDIIQFKSYISASQYLLAYQLVLQYIPTSADILDWGTGSGHFSFFLLEHNYRVTGFTIQNDCTLSQHLKTKFPDQFTYISDPKAIKTLPLKSNSFDVVTSIGVLEHVRDSGGIEQDSLLEIKRILKPGGFFICYHFPNKYSWIELITKHLKNKYNHKYKFSRQDIQKMLEKVNFELIDTKRYGLFPRLSFGNFPDYILLTKLFNYTDIIFSKFFNFLCQNHYFIAKKHA